MLKIVDIQVAKLEPYAMNSKLHTAAQIDAVVASIEEFGFVNPVLIDRKGGIIAGHCRVMAAKQMGLITVPCIKLGHLSEEQRKAYVIADNRLSEIGAGWDRDKLAAELNQIGEIDVGAIGFDMATFRDLVGTLEPSPTPLPPVFTAPAAADVNAGEYHPTTPTANAMAGNVSADDMEKAGQRLANNVAPVPTQLSVMCPGCGNEFLVDKK